MEMEKFTDKIKGKYSKVLVVGAVFLFALIAFSGVFAYLNWGQEAMAVAQASKVLIIANDDTYSASTVSGGSSADNMKATLVAYGFDANAITVWKESQNGSAPPPLSTLNQYDVVIFSQGVGYRNTSNNRQGLNVNDLNLLKQYLNITSSGNKARLLIEGEDVMSDIARVGTSTDQRNVLKINTSSSSDNYGRITRLNITDTTHPAFKYPYDISAYTQANTSYQTNFQDYVSPNLTVGAKTIASANFSGRTGSYAVMNSWENSTGNRQIFIPFAWRVDGTSSNTISDYTVNSKQWRDQLLVNMVTWVGERKISVSRSDIADYSASPSETSEMLSLTLTPSMVETTVTTPVISEIKVSLTGTIDQTKVTAKIFEDKGIIGSLDGLDTELGSASFVGGIATIPVNLQVLSTKNLIVAYQFAPDVADKATAVANLTASSFVVHSLDRLTRVYSPNIQSSPTTVRTTGTAALNTPVNGSSVGGNVGFAGTTSTSYTLSYTSGYNNQTGPWTQFAAGAGSVSNGNLGTWDSTEVPDGAYTVKLAVDTGTETYVSLYVDNTAPQISKGPLHSDLRDISVTINWTTNESSNSKVVYRVSPSGVEQNVSDSTKVEEHSIKLNSLAPNTTYAYKVVSADSVGNEVTSVEKYFTTYDLGPVAEITSPATVAQMAPRVSDAVDIIGSAYTSKAGHSVVWAVYYGRGFSEEEVTAWQLIDSGNNSVTDGLITTWNAPLTDGAYVLRLSVRDPELTGVTAENEFYLPVIVDNTKPEIFNVNAINVTNSTACITWETSKLTVDEVAYGPAPGILPYSFVDTDKDKMIFLYGLQPNTTYFYRITAVDLGEHETKSPELSFTTTNFTGDTTPPVVSSVSLTAAGRTESTIDLKWNAAHDESGIAGYTIYRSLDNEHWEAIGGVHGQKLTFTDTDLNQDHIYYYSLTAIDPYGNESVQTPGIQVLTMAVGRINPHGAYSKLTVMCSKCHTVHRGKKEFLFNRTQEATMCYTCHDAAGTGSKYAIEAEYDPSHTSRHPLPMNHTSKECASCHNPHLNGTEYPRLLASKNSVTGVVYSKGNGFCYNCHGVGAPERTLENTAGEHEVFELSVHNLGEKMPDPVSGSEVKCVLCHANHSSAYYRLTLAKEEENCYLCHGDSAEEYGIRNSKQDITKTSFHNVDGNETIGNVECVNCHNPHYIRSALLNTSNPYNTNEIWTGDRSTFCVTCHSTNTPPQKHETKDELVPYTVFFPDFQPTTIVGTPGAKGGWDKSPYVVTSPSTAKTAHYGNATKPVQCTDCHSPHGSAYQRMVSREEDSFRSNTDGSCSICHSAAGEWRALYGGANIPDVYTHLTESYAHPVLEIDSTYKHSDTEDYKTLSLEDKHAECQDCHDPHLAKRTGTKVGNLSGPLNNVKGVTRSGASLVYTSGAATEDWQICYKCHSSYWDNLNAAGMRDIAAEFYRTNSTKSYHFVELTSNDHVASFSASKWTAGSTDKDGNPWTATSKMYCQDCHGSPTGAKGPHGSPNQSMLKGSYYTFEETTRASTADDLICFKCHSRTYYESTSSHDLGKGERHDVPCWWCHGSRVHGTVNRHLIVPYNISVPEWHPDYEENSKVRPGTTTHANTTSKGSCSIRANSGSSSCDDHGGS